MRIGSGEEMGGVFTTDSTEVTDGNGEKEYVGPKRTGMGVMSQ